MKTLNLLRCGIFGLFLYACSNDDSGSSDLNSLKSVDFKAEEAQVISSTRTGNTRFNSATSTTEFEYINVVKRQLTLSPLSFIDAQNTEVIFPGSVLRGETFLEGSYDPLVLKTPFKDVMVSVSLRGKNLPVQATSQPKISEVRTVTNNLLAKYKSEIDHSFVPAYVNYQADKITSSSSFNRSFNLHTKAKVLAGLVSAKFNYQDNQSYSENKKYVMVKLYQNFYSVSIDPKHLSEWFDGPIDTKEFGSHEPLYVSNVNYGRAAYLLIETTDTTEDIHKMVSGAVNYTFKAVTGSAGANNERTLRKLFSDSKIRVLIVGGPAKLAGEIDSYEKFVEFIKTPTIEDLISSAAPISYTVRRLKNNTEVEVRSFITENEVVYHPE